MDVVGKRKRLKLSQADFWARVGVTQSGGSRYEAGRRIPEPVNLLLGIAYGTAAERSGALKRLNAST